MTLCFDMCNHNDEEFLCDYTDISFIDIYKSQFNRNYVDEIQKEEEKEEKKKSIFDEEKEMKIAIGGKYGLLMKDEDNMSNQTTNIDLRYQTNIEDVKEKKEKKRKNRKKKKKKKKV